MSDDFFEKLDKQIAEADAKANAQQVDKEANEAFAKVATAEMMPIARDYKDKLSSRGISAGLQGHDMGLTFTLKYGDGKQVALTAFPDLETKRLQFNTHYPEGNSWDGHSYGAANWNVDVFRKKLEDLISGYLREAPKHRGYL